MRAKKKRTRKPKLKLVSLHARDNEALAGLLNATAIEIAESRARVTGYIVITTVAEGQVGAAYCSANEVELVGALEALKKRIMAEW